MPATIFQNLHKKRENSRVVDARKWFRNQAQKSKVTPSSILRDSTLTQRPLPGRMFLFQYKAKYAKELPYWDKFPLIFYMKHKGPTFAGINVHYLPPALRAILMDQLYDYVVNMDNMNQSTYVNITYDILSRAGNLYKPCFKLYRRDHLQSNFLYIPPKDWDIALMLPLARFQKGTINKVYRDARKTLGADSTGIQL